MINNMKKIALLTVFVLGTLITVAQEEPKAGCCKTNATGKECTKEAKAACTKHTGAESKSCH